MGQRSLADGLGLALDPDAMIGFRDERGGLEYLLPAARLREGGLRLTLDAYRCQVFTNFRELRDGAGQPWSRLAAQLNGAGVPSLEDAIRDIELAPVHDALQRAVADIASLPDLTAAIAAAGLPLLPRLAVGDPVATASASRRIAAIAAIAAIAKLSAAPREAAILHAWALLDPIAATFGGPAMASLRLAGPLDGALASRHGLGGDDAHGLTTDAIALIAAAASLGTGPRPPTVPARLKMWLADPIIRAGLGINAWEGVEWIDADRLAALADRWAATRIVDGTTPRTARADATRLRRAVERAGYRVDAVVAPAARRTRPR